MKKLFVLLLTLALFAPACAFAQALLPSDVVGGETHIAGLVGWMPSSFIDDVKAGKARGEGTISTFASAVEVQTLTEGLMLLNSDRVGAFACLYPSARYISAYNPQFEPVRAVYQMTMHI